MKNSYKIIDHTADFGIHVFGSNPKELFANAALAMFDVITDLELLTGLKARKVHIRADDWPDLMVNWLRELLYLWAGKEMLVKHVDILSISEYELTALVYVDRYDLNRHVINNEIKV
ncbi:MAG: archease [Deltaproteobacteria bacterium]|nr:archease [Deltaproteobacteria bacterium]